MKRYIVSMAVNGRADVEVLAENPDEAFEAAEMGDRVDELDMEIDRLWRQLGDVDDKVLCQLILCCIEQEQLEPGRIVDSLKDY